MNPLYVPTGRTAVMVGHMRKDPDPARIFSAVECARVMGCKPKAVGRTLEYAIRARAIFMRNTGKRNEYSLTEMAGAVILPPTKRRGQHQHGNPERQPKSEPGWLTDPEDPRIGKVVPGWKPPVMRHVRGGA